MKKNILMKNLMVRFIFLFLILVASLVVKSQMPDAITIEPSNATAYDELTLTFDPAQACFQSGTLAGLPYIAMHSGISFINGQTWQHIVPFNCTGFNGQSTLLYPTGDGRYSITYTPADYYALAGQPVTEICAVFNNGTNWNQDGRDYAPIGYNCRDFFIPLTYQWPYTEFHFKANMNKMIAEGNFSPLTDSLFSYVDQPAVIRLFDSNSDGIYEGVYNINLVVGQNYICQFRINDSLYEEILRNVTVEEGTTYITGWWNDEPDPYISVTIADFEDGTNGAMFMHVMGCGEYDYEWLHSLSESFYIVDNPDPSELNPSMKVMKFIRRGLQWGAYPWGGFFAQCVPPLDITFMKYVHVKIWKPRISPVRFKLEAGYDGTFEIVSGNPQTLINEWEEVIFDYNLMNGFFPIIAFMPDYEDPLMLNGDIEIYFDDIIVNNIPYPIYVGSDESLKNKLDIYPNPVENFLFIIGGNTMQTVVIYDIAGKEVYRINQLAPGDNRINTGDLTPGLYFVTVKNDHDNQYCRKFVKH